MSGGDQVDAMAVFAILDEDESGTLSSAEVRQGVKEAFGPTSPPPSKIDSFFKIADMDGSGFIDPEEFTSLVRSLCQYMRLTTNAFHAAVTRSEFSKMFEKIQIDDHLSRSDTLQLLVELCTTMNSSLSPEQLLRALDLMSCTDKDVTAEPPQVEQLTKGDFMTLLAELTQNRPSPAVSRTFKIWEKARREAIKNRKAGLESESPAPGSAAAATMAVNQQTSACTNCIALMKEIKTIQAEFDEQTEELLSATQRVSQNVEDAAVHAAKEQKFKITLASREEKIKDLQYQLSQGEKKIHELEGLNKALASSNARNTKEVDITNDKLRNAEERIKLAERETADMKLHLLEQRKLQDFFRGLDITIQGLVSSNLADVNQVRSEALDTQAAAIKAEKRRLFRDEVEVRQKNIDVDRKMETAKKLQTTLEERATRLAARELAFEKNQQIAERTSLPEREHRMERIAEMERVVSNREAYVQEKLEEIAAKDEVIGAAENLMLQYMQCREELKEARAAIALHVDSIPPSVI